MRICPSCGRENADDRDFCTCGEYLRWEPTQHVEALTPSAARQAGETQSPPEPAARPAPADPNVTLPPATPAVAAPAETAGAGRASLSPPAAADLGPPPAGAATLLLRLPDDEAAATGPVSLAVKPGQRATLIALIRNESGVVDNYDLLVAGLPDGWWTSTPATVYLVPYGTGDRYEQEVQIQVHPPRSPDAHAKAWPFEVVAYSRAYATEIARAPAAAQIEPYHEIASQVTPDRASGRLKARFVLTVRNRANAATEVRLHAEDTDGECEFHFAEPSVTIEPGQGVEAPFRVIPPKQIWIGRPKDRPIRVTATPVGDEQPPPPRPATFRQRSWLPWWLAIVAPVAAAIAVAVILLLPKQTVVPNLTHASSAFAAQKLVLAAGLKLSPQVAQKPDPGAPVGSVVAQTPAAGKKVKRGSLVSIEVALGSGKATILDVTRLTPVTADTQLRAAGLALGAVSPQPPNPNGVIASQIPAARQQVAVGTPVAVFLQPAASGKKAGAAAAGAGAAAAAGGAAAGAGGAAGATGGGAGGAGGGGATGSGAAGGKPIVIPSVNGNVMAAAQKLSQLGLVPTSGEKFDPHPAGTLVGTNPTAGTTVPTGSKVKLLVSAGWPDLSYDDGQAIHVVGQRGNRVATLPPSSQPEGEASWSPDGTTLVYVQGPAALGQLMAITPGQRGAQPSALTGANSDDHHPSFAPTNSQKVLAFVDESGGGSRLCFAVVGPNLLNLACTSHPGWKLGHQVAWSPDGSKILVFGTKNGSNETVFGLIEFASNVPFSTQASLWGQGTVVTDTSRPQQGVIAGAFSPDGKQVALISNIGTLDFHVFLAPPTDFMLAPPAKALPVRACQLAWRPDSQELAVMQADSACRASFGDIVGIDPSAPDTFNAIATQGEDPAWQPRSLGG